MSDNTQTVYIGDLDTYELLHALWEASPPAIFYEASFIPPPEWDEEKARCQIEKGDGHFDYVQGRVIKLNLSGLEVNPSGYDRDNGQGAVAKVVQGLRDQKNKR
ncbi:hypothetical protein BDW62DRAFT_206810 [Aspergillus aurantiobrunneus]